MMLSLLHELHPHWKLVLATTSAGILAAVDAVTDLAGAEDFTLKMGLAIALIFVVRLLLKQQDEHKKEMQELREKGDRERDSREERMLQAIEDNSGKLGELATLTKEQTEYFKSVTRNIVERHIKGPDHLP